MHFLFENSQGQLNLVKSEILTTLSDFQAKLVQLTSRSMSPVRTYDDTCPSIANECQKDIVSLHGSQTGSQPIVTNTNHTTNCGPSSGNITLPRSLSSKSKPQHFKRTSKCKPAFRFQNRFLSLPQVSKVHLKAFASKFLRPPKNCQNLSPKGQHFKTADFCRWCFRCARRHSVSFCPAINAQCRNCLKLHHFARACHTGLKPESRDVRTRTFRDFRTNVSDHVTTSHSQYYTPLKVNRVTSTAHTAKKTSSARRALNTASEISISVYDKHRFALVDTESNISAISAKFFKELPIHRQLDKN